MITKKQYKRKINYKPRRKGFAAKVMNVVNKKAEVKQHTYEPGGIVLTDNSLTTWNLNATLGQGTTTSQRIGDKIFIKNLRIKGELENWDRLTGVTSNVPITFRIIVFRGKYDYLLSNYPITEVFERTAGVNPTNYVSARVDRNQVTCFYDKTFQLNNSELGLKKAIDILKYIKMNKQFKFRDDDSFGQSSNLYLGIVSQSSYDPLTPRSAGLLNFSFTYTDV